MFTHQLDNFRLRNHGQRRFSLLRIHSFDPRNHIVQVVDNIHTLNGPRVYLSSIFTLPVSFWSRPSQ